MPTPSPKSSKSPTTFSSPYFLPLIAAIIFVGILLLVFINQKNQIKVDIEPPFTEPPTSQPQPATPTSSTTSTWQTYKGNEFTLSTPPNWNFDGQVLLNYDTATISPKAGFPRGSIKCDFGSHDPSKNVQIVKNIINAETTVKRGKITFSGDESMTGDPVEYTYFLIQKADISKGLVCYAYDPAQEPVVNQILSTFKFTK